MWRGFVVLCRAVGTRRELHDGIRTPLSCGRPATARYPQGARRKPAGDRFRIGPNPIDTASIAPYLAQSTHRTTTQFLFGIIPNTFVGAFAEGNVLQVLFVSVLCGFA